MNYKKLIFTALVLILGTGNLLAHYLWIETKPVGKIGKSQEIKVFFGEYTYGLQEKVGEKSFDAVKKFKAWVVAPNGSKTELVFEPTESSYLSSFTPESAGTYTVVLNNNEIDVIDYTKYDFGIFKTHYHSIAKITVKGGAENTVAMNPEGITIVDVSQKPLSQGEELKFQIRYKGEPLAEQEVNVFVADQWSKKLTTDENGEVSLKLPWDTKFIVEVTKNEKVPGNYKGEDYEFIYHCATYCVDVSKG
ncbi:DUF4198 domain-containing protein [Reichenbachiella sp. MALMAid0571]|uniref:DUF4198 domain-containing protein n=1 Tax=Reichenbachiella sp. MALMAid0571 TaxID=3143939 RepID=UPI0032DFEBBD